jgi:lipoprotein signal peptidase
MKHHMLPEFKLTHIQKAIFLVLGFMFLIMPLDQGLKLWSASHYLIHEDTSDLSIYQGARETWLDFSLDKLKIQIGCSYVRNFGSTAGILRTLDRSIRLPFLVFMGVALSVSMFVLLLWLIKQKNMHSAICTSVIISASFGNLLDRVRVGYVIDSIYIMVEWAGIRYLPPVFNVADICLVFGALGFAWTLILHDMFAQKIRRIKMK